MVLAWTTVIPIHENRITHAACNICIRLTSFDCYVIQYAWVTQLRVAMWVASKWHFAGVATFEQIDAAEEESICAHSWMRWMAGRTAIDADWLARRVSVELLNCGSAGDFYGHDSCEDDSCSRQRGGWSDALSPCRTLCFFYVSACWRAYRRNNNA